MPDRNTLKHHAELIDRMAGTVGVDLQEAVLSGEIPFDTVADAVLRCTQCSDPGHCAWWLDAHPVSAAPPGYCANADLFAALIPETRS